MAIGPFITVDFVRARESVVSGGVQTSTLTVTNPDGVNATVKVSVSVPMSRNETTRAFTSTGTNVSGNTTSGSTAIADAAVILTGQNSQVIYTILSTYTLPTGRTFATSTLLPVVQVVQRPNGTGVTEAAYNKFTVTYIGAAAETTQATSSTVFGFQRTAKTKHTDAQQVAFRTVGFFKSDYRGQRVIDDIEEGAKDAWDTIRTLRYTKVGKVVTTAVSYTILDDEFMVVGSTTLTLTFPSPTDPDNLGRVLVIKNSHAANTVTLSGTISDTITTVVATKARMFVCDGATWQSVSVIA